MDDDLGAMGEAVGPDRRTFLRRLIIGTAFAAPVVSSFTMSGMQSVFASTPRSTTLGMNSNTTPPPSTINNFPTEVACFTVLSSGLNVTENDGAVQLHLVVPAGALPTNSTVCIYRANLAALAGIVPAGQTPVSGYAVVWSVPGGGSPDATAPITLTVTDPAVSNNDPIYVVDKTTGNVTSAGTASGSVWVVAFTVDPGFVVTQVTTLTVAPSFTG